MPRLRSRWPSLRWLLSACSELQQCKQGARKAWFSKLATATGSLNLRLNLGHGSNLKHWQDSESVMPVVRLGVLSNLNRNAISGFSAAGTLTQAGRLPVLVLVDTVVKWPPHAT